MDKQEFQNRVFDVALGLQKIHFDRTKTWDEKNSATVMLVDELYQECRDAFSKVQKFG